MAKNIQQSPTTGVRVIGRPAVRVSRAREIAFRKAVRHVLVEHSGNGFGPAEFKAAAIDGCCNRSLAEHLRPFSGPRRRRPPARVSR